MSTYGPAYSEGKDGKRIRKQHEVIRDYMLSQEWRNLADISYVTGIPEASVSAQLRHLRKLRFGSHDVEKRRRGDSGTWEYRVRKPEPKGQMRLV